MSRSAKAPRSLMIGGAAFDPATGEIKGPAGAIRLAPQPSTLLALLAERRGDLVSRAKIAERLWPAGTNDPQQGIAFAVREIRKALERSGGDPAVVETIPRRGLRLQAEPVAEPEREPVAKSELGSEPVAERSIRSRRDPGSGRRLTVGVGLIVALAAAALLAGLGTTPTMVVFQHADDGDAASADLASDLSNQLTSSLTATFEDRLGVIGPTGARSLDGPNDVEVARSAMGACWVMSGSVSLHADEKQAVIFTQIVRTQDRVHVWAEQDTVPMANAAAAALPVIIRGVRDVLGDC